MFEIETITAELRDLSKRLDYETFDGRDAARLTEVAAEAERLCAAIKVGYARRAVDTNGWRTRDRVSILPEDWFAKISGCSTWQARDALKTAERLQECPKTAQQVRNGDLSMQQASAVSKAASLDPDAEDRLLRTAQRGEYRRLKEESERVIASATDEDEARARATRERYFRTWTNGMATCGSFSGPTEDVAALLAAIKPLAERAFTEARATKDPERHESPAAYQFDGLIALARGETPEATKNTKSSSPVTRIRVDLEALVRGRTEPGEVCEIPGVGPIPVAHARRVLPHGLLELVITDGIDVQTVVSTTRHIPKPLEIALDERDGRRCKARGCEHTVSIERHHTLDFADGQLTTYRILGDLCRDHHHLVTHCGYTIAEHDDGTWTLHPPGEHQEGDERHTDAA